MEKESASYTRSNTHQEAYCPRSVRVENYVTHNGDFDFYELNGRDYELQTIQNWLEIVTGVDRPAPVDSAAIAGMIDLLRTQGCFGLSVRYAVSLGLPSSRMVENPSMAKFPTYQDCERVGNIFEEALLKTFGEAIGGEYVSLHDIGDDPCSTLPI